MYSRCLYKRMTSDSDLIGCKYCVGLVTSGWWWGHWTISTDRRVMCEVWPCDDWGLFVYTADWRTTSHCTVPGRRSFYLPGHHTPPSRVSTIEIRENWTLSKLSFIILYHSLLKNKNTNFWKQIFSYNIVTKVTKESNSHYLIYSCDFLHYIWFYNDMSGL